jgi:hypothetical protein
MPLKENQPRTGHLSEDSPNDTDRTGRKDGTGPNQPRVGHLDEESGPIGGKTGRDSGFKVNQGKLGYPAEDSGPDKGTPNTNPERIDEVKEIG